jgi:parallel beta-helix repeat protein
MLEKKIRIKGIGYDHAKEDARVADKAKMPLAIWFISVLTALLMLSVPLSLMAASTPSEHVVMNVNAESGYGTIQEAVDAASAGDTIVIGSGTYNEQVTVDKPLTIVGEDRAGTIVVSDGYLYAFLVTSESVSISDMTVSSTASQSDAIYFDGAIGIYLYGAVGCTIDSVDVTGFGYGILAEFCTGITVSDSTLSSNGYGIYVDYSTNVVVSGNSMSSNVFGNLVMMHASVETSVVVNLNTQMGYFTIQEAVDAASAGDTIVIGTGTYNEQVTVDKSLTIVGEDRAGTIVVSNDNLYAFLVTAEGVTISNLMVTQDVVDVESMYFDGDIGIYLYGAVGCTIENVDVSGFGYGILAEFCSDVVFSGGSVSSNGYGLYIDYSTGMTVTDTTAMSNAFDGVHVHATEIVSISGGEMSYNGIYGLYVDACNQLRMSDINMTSNVGDDLYVNY